MVFGTKLFSCLHYNTQKFAITHNLSTINLVLTRLLRKFCSKFHLESTHSLSILLFQSRTVSQTLKCFLLNNLKCTFLPLFQAILSVLFGEVFLEHVRIIVDNSPLRLPLNFAKLATLLQVFTIWWSSDSTTLIQTTFQD